MERPMTGAFIRRSGILKVAGLVFVISLIWNNVAWAGGFSDLLRPKYAGASEAIQGSAGLFTPAYLVEVQSRQEMLVDLHQKAEEPSIAYQVLKGDPAKPAPENTVNGGVVLQQKKSASAAAVNPYNTYLVNTYVPGGVLPPALRSVAVSTITATTATIRWTTDQASSTRILYGLNPGQAGAGQYAGGIVNNGTLTTSHSATLTGLRSNARYYYVVESTNARGMTSASAEYTFDTIAPSGYVSGTVVSTAGGKVLVVSGTGYGDTISVTQDASGIAVAGSGYQQRFTTPVIAVEIYGGAGDDTITVAASVKVPARIYGGTGSNKVYALNPAANTINVIDGSNLVVVLNDAGARSTVTGGTGLDSYWVTSGTTITNVSADETAANSVHRIGSFYQPYTTLKSSPDYVSLNIAGQDLRDPVAEADYKNYASVPLFRGNPQYCDIEQKNVGDCYFMATLASLTQTNPLYGSGAPDWILQSVAPLGDGTFGVRFYNTAGHPEYLRIDADLPAGYFGDPYYAGLGERGVLWVALLEKAYAYYRVLNILDLVEFDLPNDYESLDSGYSKDAFHDLTGYGADVRMIWATPYAYFRAKLSAGYAVTLSNGHHVYSLRSVQTVGGIQYATVYNPWGYDGGMRPDNNTDDGLITLTMQELGDCFSSSTVSRVRIY